MILRKEPAITWRAWLAWGIVALFYLTGFYQRVSPAAMTSELIFSDSPRRAWLERNWSGALANGAHVYALHAHQTAFFLIVGWAVLASVLISATCETHCRALA